MHLAPGRVCTPPKKTRFAARTRKWPLCKEPRLNTLHCLATGGSLRKPDKIPPVVVEVGEGGGRRTPASPPLWMKEQRHLYLPLPGTLYIAALNYSRGTPVTERLRRMISLEVGNMEFIRRTNATFSRRTFFFFFFLKPRPGLTDWQVFRGRRSWGPPRIPKALIIGPFVPSGPS